MKKKFWTFRAAATDPTVGELLIYGNVGPDDGMGWLFDEISPKMFKDDLDALGDIKSLNVMINSNGGDVFAGQAIHSMLKRWNGQVTVYIDGLAASIASVIAMAGDKVVMPSNAMMMIHNPWVMAMGDANEFRKLAGTLDDIRGSIVAAYSGKTGMTADELIPMLDEETWLTAEDAVKLGFADEIEETKKIAATVRGGVVTVNNLVMDLSKFKHVPDLSKTMGAARDAGTPTKRDAENALRDAGLSVSAAKRILASGWRDAPMHEVMTGMHTHSHPANGDQGGDVTHEHPHSHSGDNTHAHSHTADNSTHQHPRGQYQPEPYHEDPDELVVCPQCECHNESDANYCDQCGFDLTTTGYEPAEYDAEDDETVQCPQCKRMNDTDASYCDQCGYYLVGSDAVTEAEPVDAKQLLLQFHRMQAEQACIA